jgi:serpin B
VLRLPAAGPRYAAGLRDRAALLASLNRAGVTFRSSNRVWASSTFRIQPAFQSALWTGYQAGLRRVPFLTVLQNAIKMINAAVSADTRRHIPALLSPSGLLPPPSLLVTDALYLDAAWAAPFDPAAIQPGPFQAATGPVTARYLTGTGLGTATAAGWTAAALPYRGDRLEMLALLPPPGKGCQLPPATSLSALALQASGLGATRAAIGLPEVNLSGSESLRPALTGLGLGAAFGPGANFKGISAQACCLGNVAHAATLQVTAAGTIASAATGVSVQPGAAAPPRHVLRFSRPYLLALLDTVTAEPLMLAWVANPAAR